MSTFSSSGIKMRDVLLVGQSPTSSSKQEVGCQPALDLFCCWTVCCSPIRLQYLKCVVFTTQRLTTCILICGRHEPYPHIRKVNGHTPTKSRVGAVNIAEPAKNKSSAGLTPDLSFYWKRLGSTQLIYYMVLSEE